MVRTRGIDAGARCQVASAQAILGRRVRALCSIVFAGLLIAGLTAIADPVRAQDPDTETAAQLPRSDGSFTGGGQWWWQDEPDFRYREYKDLPQGLFLDSFLWRDWSGQFQFALVGEKALRGDQNTVLRVNRGSRLGLELSYQEIPHLLSQIATTPYAQPNPGLFTMPDSVRARVQSGQTTSYAALTDLLTNSARNPELHTGTDIAGARLGGRLSREWSLGASVQRRNRDGYRARTAGLGTSPGNFPVSELGAPESDRTVDAQVGGGYTGERLRGQITVGHSWFDNKVNSLQWDNYLRVSDQPLQTNGTSLPGRAQLSVFPSNRVLHGTLGLSYELARATLLSASLGLKRGTQDEPWLPYTINTSLPQSSPDSLPGVSTNAKFVQNTQDVRLTTRAVSRLTATARFHHLEYDNQTEEFTFTGRSVGDANWEVGPFDNHTPGFARIITGLDATYDVSRVVDVGGLIEWRQRTFDEREVEETEEVVWGASARVRPVETITLTGRYRHGTRDASEFDFDTERLATPFDVADRRQDVVGAGATWALREDLDLILAYDLRDNTFPHSTWGLQQEREEIGTGAVTVHPRNDLDLTAGFGLGRIKVFMRDNHIPNPVGGVPQPAHPDSTWLLDINDRNTWGFARADWWPVARKVRLSGEYEYMRGRATYDFTTPLGNAVDPPETEYWTHEVEAQAMYRVRFDIDLGVRYNFERAVTEDWQQGDIPILDVSPTNPALVRGLLLGAGLLPLYNAHRVAFIATKRF